MSSPGETAAFAQAVRSSFDEFRRVQLILREQYARGPDATRPPTDLLERATRRFLVDGLLRALGWDPDDPTSVTEEARATTTDGQRLFFDYLGLHPGTRAPVLLIEAKGFDVRLPRRPRGPEMTGRDLSALVAEAVDAIRRGDAGVPVVSEWAEFLRDMHGYVNSLDEFGRSTLRRAVISAGGWTIVFREPLAAFVGEGPTNVDHVHCFTSVDDLLLRHVEVYGLLHRARLVDTLPMTLKVAEAFEMLPARRLRRTFRGVLVATSPSTGGRRQRYPTRSVYPALVVDAGDRWFAIVDYDGPIEEPRGADRIDAFLARLEKGGAAFERRLVRCYGPVSPLPIEAFPGFETSPHGRPAHVGPIAAVPGSTVDRRSAGAPPPWACVTHSGEVGAPAEYVVVTGVARFYKSDGQSGESCPFHFWKDARDDGVAATRPHEGYVVDSFTQDGQDRHCAHHDLMGLRAGRCVVRMVETHLCCLSCLFASRCWGDQTERRRLPCPP